ncbi:hypothetical protein PLICRDRAFT_48289 [Plicaturopsis crispa FD-325 SS-3]|nr:hypothetical protein PLICRDRAFT_48289 [Plicaturopsis crispa FD-325 SS-3]
MASEAAPHVALRIELPAFSHDFTVSVPASASVLDVKRAITLACPGEPRVDGQRLVWRGRYLRDEEQVSEIWKTEDETRVVHLAVHPSAWTSEPPQVHTSPTTTRAPIPSVTAPTHAVHRPFRVNTTGPTRASRTPVFSTRLPNEIGLGYIRFKHHVALTALTTGTILSPPTINPVADRAEAVRAVAAHGWSWPDILDEPYPAPTADEQSAGVRYERVTIDGKDYLRLVDSDSKATPTPLQAHALKVLTYTFSFLSAPPPPSHQTQYTSYPATTGQGSTTTTHHVQIPIPLPPFLQQANAPIPAHAAAPNVNNANIRLRPLLLPLVMLGFRTMLLLYFFSPARKPVFGLLVGAWIAYEAWVAYAHAGEVQRDRGGVAPAAAAAADPAPAAAQAQAPAPREGEAPTAAGGPNAQPPRPAQPPRTASPQPHAVPNFIDTLAKIGLSAEEAVLSPSSGQQPTPPPTLAHKVGAFFSLLFLTLHPAIWNGRRTALRAREGRLRTEAHARARVDGGEEVDERQARVRRELAEIHERRPAWVRDYVERVQHAEWVDDA